MDKCIGLYNYYNLGVIYVVQTMLCKVGLNMKSLGSTTI